MRRRAPIDRRIRAARAAHRHPTAPGSGSVAQPYPAPHRFSRVVFPIGAIWFSAHCLQLIDPQLAREQYDRARAELGRALLGFGYAREWPAARPGPPDIDSGPIVPGLEASPGSSGLALVAAAAFDDRSFYQQLLTSLSFAAFPIEDDGGLRFAVGNQVGDAVILYSMVLGPLWQRALRREARR